MEQATGEDGASYFHTIVSDCIDLCKHFNHVIVQFVRGSANGVTHLLATHSTSGLREWVDNPPEFIHHVLSFEFISVMQVRFLQQQKVFMQSFMLLDLVICVCV